ncbi:hypothetical protein BH09MYX1_BH09MYX1_05690 [soil metagenome]
MRHSLLAFAAPCVLTFVFACGAHEPNPKMAAETTPKTAAASPSDTANEASPGDPQGLATPASTDNGVTTAPPAPFTESQVLAIADAAHIAVITQGNLAVTKASDPRVKKFAQHAIAQHTDAKTRQDALVTKNKWTLEASPMSQDVTRRASTANGDLSSKSGKAFDRAYIALQLQEQRIAIAALDDKVLPSTKTPELRQLLMEVRSAIAERIQAGEELQTALGS